MSDLEQEVQGIEDNSYSEFYFDVYSNSTSIYVGVFDFMFEFFEDSPRGKKTLGFIKMSPQHAKAFSSILTKNIKNYEEKIGEIHLVEKESKNAKKKNNL